jgi:Acetyltransferase (GNAT) domain
VNIIETSRLILRRFTSDDAAFILELLNEPEWKRNIGDRGINSLESARRYLETGPIASYARRGFGLYAIEQKVDSTLVGMCGLIKRDGLDDVDIGFAILSRFEKQGLTTKRRLQRLRTFATRSGLENWLQSQASTMSARLDFSNDWGCASRAWFAFRKTPRNFVCSRSNLSRPRAFRSFHLIRSSRGLLRGRHGGPHFPDGINNSG